MPPPSSGSPTLKTASACYYQSQLSTYKIANCLNLEAHNPDENNARSFLIRSI